MHTSHVQTAGMGVTSAAGVGNGDQCCLPAVLLKGCQSVSSLKIQAAVTLMQLLHCSSPCPLSILCSFPDPVHLCLALCNSGIDGLHINRQLDPKPQHISCCFADGKHSNAQRRPSLSRLLGPEMHIMVHGSCST